jgi:hypothetical protein
MDHLGFRTQYAASFGHAVIMLRQPEQRLISAYHNPPTLEWPLNPFYYADHSAPHGWPWVPNPQPKNLLEYAKALQGCAVKQLTRDGNWPCYNGTAPPTATETQLAVQMLHEGFVFVGLTDQYDLSICLFHKMFGNPCDSHDFMVAHTGPEHQHTSYDTEELHGFRDIYDGEVYAAATDVFNKNLQLYGVSSSACESCFRQAQLLPQ